MNYQPKVIAETMKKTLYNRVIRKLADETDLI